MKKYLLLFCTILLMQTVFAQHFPDYNDTFLNKKISEFECGKKKKKLSKDSVFMASKYVSNESYLDTIFPIFSEFVTGSNLYAKNSNALIADLNTKDTRITYNTAYAPRKGLILNAELFALGKDNIAGIFNESKLQGAFGFGLSTSKIIHSCLGFKIQDACDLIPERQSYFWYLKEKGTYLMSLSSKQKIQDSVQHYADMISDPRGKPVDVLYSKLVLYQDSLKKFLKNSSDLEQYYIEKIVAFEKKKAKWTSLNLITFDVKYNYSSEGFNYYSMVPVSTAQNQLFPTIVENGYRFSRNKIALNLNHFWYQKYFSHKLTLSGAFGNSIGFDSYSPKDISEEIKFDSTNYTRSFTKKYTAYEDKTGIRDRSSALFYSVNEQLFLGEKKNFGLEFQQVSKKELSGQFKERVTFDRTIGFLIAINKKDDTKNKNVIAIRATVPDVSSKTSKSFDKDGKKLKVKDKMEIGISFGLALNKLHFKF